MACSPARAALNRQAEVGAGEGIEAGCSPFRSGRSAQAVEGRDAFAVIGGRCQGLQVALVGSSTNLVVAAQVGHPLRMGR